MLVQQNSAQEPIVKHHNSPTSALIVIERGPATDPATGKPGDAYTGTIHLLDAAMPPGAFAACLIRLANGILDDLATDATEARETAMGLLSAPREN